MKKDITLKKEIPLYDPYTGEANPEYEKLTGKVNPLIKKNIEYKRSNRFLVNFPKSFNIDPILVSSIELPSVYNKTKKFLGITYSSEMIFSDIRVSIKEIENNSFISEFNKKMQRNETFDLTVDILNGFNKVLTKITLKECSIVLIENVGLDYNNNDISMCNLAIKPKYVNYYHKVK